MTTNTSTTIQTSTSASPRALVSPAGITNLHSTGTQSITDTVTYVPYIKPQQVAFQTTNMRPNIPLHFFFDSVNVDSWVAPAVLNGNTISYANSVSRTGLWGEQVFSNANGVATGIFLIPEASFKWGERVFECCDSAELAQGNNLITTIASASFTASYLNATDMLSSTLAATNQEYSVLPMSNTVIGALSSTINTAAWGSNTNFNSLNDYITESYADAFAQVFLVQTPHGEDGMYATKIDLFFATNSRFPAHGAVVYVCEAHPVGAGGAFDYIPNFDTILPHSRVHLPNTLINGDVTSATSTTFTFTGPVYLQNNKRYAWVVKYDAGDSDFEICTAKLGDKDIITGNHIYNQSIMIESAYHGVAGASWTPLPNEFFKFTLYCAKFTQATGQAVFNNRDTDYITALNILYPNPDPTYRPILPGDVVYKASNGNVNATGAAINASVNGVVTYFDRIRGVLYVDNSTKNFTPNGSIQVHRFVNSSLSTANSSTIVAFGNTYSMYSPKVHGMVGQFAKILPSSTGMVHSYLGASNSFVLDVTASSIIDGAETMFSDYERVVASGSIENSVLANSKSVTITCNLFSSSEFLSPLIDTTKMDPLVIRNNLDPISSVYEEFFNSGYSKSKWISNVITLAPGQDSEDLQVVVNAYRPYGTDVQVWVKFINSLDTDSILDKTWTPMVNQNATQYTDPANPKKMFSYTYTVPLSYPMLPTTGTITSNNTSTTVTGNGTLFGTESFIGWRINSTGTNEISRQIINIANGTSLILDVPFINNHTNTPYFIVPPATAAFLATDILVPLQGTVDPVGNKLIGTGTAFDTQLVPGNVVKVPPFYQTVQSIANSTQISSPIPWGSSGQTGLTAYQFLKPGVTYVNDNFTYFSTFNAFQLKIIMQSNNPIVSPLLSSVTATSMLL